MWAINSSKPTLWKLLHFCQGRFLIKIFVKKMIKRGKK